MSDKSKIEWTDATWNPVTGCTKVSEGCRNCYAKTFAERFEGTPGHYFETGFKVTLRPERLDQPFRWKRPRRIFVNSMSDLFHDDIPDNFIWNVFQVMARCPQHTFQLLTKRPERMKRLLENRYWRNLGGIYALIIEGEHRKGDEPFLPNVWIGVSVENQKAANERIPLLLQTPAAIRFLSCEPLLGFLDLTGWLFLDGHGSSIESPIHWTIAGGESGHGARPMHPDWARSLRDQCHVAGVAFHFKQWGEWTPIHDLRANEPGIKGKMWHTFDPDNSVCRIGKNVAGRLLDGRTWDEMPQRSESTS